MALETVTRPDLASAWGSVGRSVWSVISTLLPQWERERVLPLPSGSDFRSGSVFEVAESSRVGEARAWRWRWHGIWVSVRRRRRRSALLSPRQPRILSSMLGAGLLLIRVLEHGQYRGVEVLAVDQGNGIADIEGCCTMVPDGRIPGTGLGGIRRARRELTYSQPGSGRRMVARLWP